MSTPDQCDNHVETARPWRLFVAVTLPDSWHQALRDAQERLRAEGLRLRYVRPESMHLTLKFLGDVRPDRVAALGEALSAAAGASHCARLELAEAGPFGAARRPRVVWIGLRGELDTLSALQATVEQALVPLGFPGDAQPFRAHITLARTPETLSAAEAARIAPAVTALARVRSDAFVVREFTLMRSELGAGGPRYTPLAEWSLIRTAN